MNLSPDLSRAISDFCCWLTYEKGVFIMDLKAMPGRDADDLIDEFARKDLDCSCNHVYRDNFCRWARDYAAKR